MIEVFTGKLGGGKTYFAVNRIIDYICGGGIVVTNIDLVLPEIKKRVEASGYMFEPDQVVQLTGEHVPSGVKDKKTGEDVLVPDVCLFHRFTPRGSINAPTLVVIDEAPLYLDSRNWAITPEEMLSFLRQSRKMSTDVIFIAQEFTDIDKKVRVLAQYIWKFLDMRKYAIPVIKIKFPLPILMQVCYDYSGKFQISMNMSVVQSYVYKCYSTTQLLRQFPMAESRKINRKKVKPRINMKHVFALYIIAAVFGFKIFWKPKEQAPPEYVTRQQVETYVGNLRNDILSGIQSIQRQNEQRVNMNEPVVIEYSDGKTIPHFPNPRYYQEAMNQSEQQSTATPKAFIVN